VVLLTHPDSNPGDGVGKMKLPLSLQGLSDGIKRRPNQITGQIKPIQLPFDSGEKQLGGKVCVLVSMDDITAIGVDKVGKFSNESPLIGAGDE
jgi:hypothetical protein